MSHQEGLTTKEAFAELMKKRAWYKNTSITKSAANTLASRFRAGELISIEKMEETLEKAGLKVIQEKLWA